MRQYVLILMVAIGGLSWGCGGGSGTVGGTADAGQDSGGTVEDGGVAEADAAVDSGVVASDAGGGEDMAPPVELEHFLYVVEINGNVHWYDLSDPAAPASLGTVGLGGRVTFGAFHPTLARFYVTNETRVEGYHIGRLSPSSVGNGSTGLGGTHLAVTTDGNALITASYGGDAVIVNPLNAGVPGDASQTLGGAGNALCERAHQVRVHPGGRWVYVPCLRSDHVAIFEWDGSSLTPQTPATTNDGMGPRHMDLHPSLDVAYVLGESNSTVEVFDVNVATGALTRKQTISTMADRTGASASSDIHVSPDGRYLYAMNRQPIHDLALFEIDQATGELSWVENVDSGGQHSRTFVVHPEQSHVYVGSSDTRDVGVFGVGADGRLTNLNADLTFGDMVWFVGVWSRPR